LHHHNIVGKSARNLQLTRSNDAGTRLHCKLLLEDLVPLKRDCSSPFCFCIDLQTPATIATLAANVMEPRM